ncbi:hypothetical protein GQ53DRAFT_754632 [Thozetella sp. PMI_491]|nr:hypothetical protein GQ53DRAFT_754632 [Thozetella sp. PMI_491]
MKLPIAAIATLLSFALAAPAPKSTSAKDNAGGRVVLDGAQCTEVQGRTVCDDGFGNTFFADDPFSS